MARFTHRIYSAHFLCVSPRCLPRYDHDLDGAINYNEFVQGLMETDFGPHARNTTTAAVAGDLNELVRLLREICTYIDGEMGREETVFLRSCLDRMLCVYRSHMWRGGC